MKLVSPDFASLPTDFLEKLYDDDSHMDVDLVASDGVVRAHSCMLSAISEPFKAMLSNGMVESSTKRVQMADFNVAQLKFILRLLYTGGMDSSEWPPEGCVGDEGFSQSSDKVIIDFFFSGVALLQFKVKSKVCYRKMMVKFCDTIGKNLDDVRFSVAGHELNPDDTPASSGLMDTAISTELVETISVEEEPLGYVALHPPLELLFSAASFAKMYDIQELLAKIIERLKACINENRFDNFMALAIKLDLAPIRMAGLLYARDNSLIKALYDQKKLKPQVQFELQAIWPAAPTKKRRLELSKSSS